MTALHREEPGAGRVLGIQVRHHGTTHNIRSRKAVIIGTGGHTGMSTSGACSIRA
jgi:hypothetical protein